MVIVYQGYFLGEGLKLLGHDVRPVRFTDGAPAAAQIEAVCPEPDLVLLELWGNSLPLPPDLHACRHRLAVYCIDSCLNEFWLLELLRVMDDVFVDQLSSVRSLARHGVNAVWLPLCVSETNFRAPQAKDHAITFVGRVDAHRKKRGNLLRRIARHYPLHQVEGVSKAEMLDIFARSKIVLNENIFSGLTLRVLHGMAAGAVVLTEAGGEGVDAYFAHERHLVCYTPATVLGRIDAILGDYARYESIARQGQEACRAGHTSRVRAGELLGHIQAGTARNTRMDAPARQCAEACARYFLCLRFGGQFRGSVAALNAISQGGGEAGARAAYILGDIHARTDRREAARHFYTQAAEKGYAFFPQSKMTLLLLQENKFQEAKTSLTSALTALPAEAAALQAELKMLPDSDAQPAALLFLLARAYAALGRIFYTGFLKQTADNFPDTALELASLAWEQSHAAAVLDFMLECAAGCGVAGELLPQLCYAIEHGLADDRQILLTAELAKQYYDQDLALRILSALRKTKEG